MLRNSQSKCKTVLAIAQHYLLSGLYGKLHKMSKPQVFNADFKNKIHIYIKLTRSCHPKKAFTTIHIWQLKLKN